MGVKLNYLLFISLRIIDFAIVHAELSCPNTWGDQSALTFKFRESCVSLVSKSNAHSCLRKLGIEFHKCIEDYCDDNFPFGHLMYEENFDELDRTFRTVTRDGYYYWLHGGILISHSPVYESNIGNDGHTYRCVNFTHWCSDRSEHKSKCQTSMRYCSRKTDEEIVVSTGATLSNLNLAITEVLMKGDGTLCRTICNTYIAFEKGLCKLYDCRDGEYNWIPCMHTGKYPCERVRTKGCNYNKSLRYCVTHYYVEPQAERQKYQRCDPDDYGERCNCTCTEFGEWTPWSATCGSIKRTRIAPYYHPNPLVKMNCSWENKIECCVETAEQTLDPCTDYIYGTNISLAKNNCAEKGGVRSRDVRGHYRCACKTGYHGHLCEQQTDHCISMPCKNGASCTSSGPYFSCKCKPGYRGDYCEESYITCDQGAVCHNDGTCKPTDDGYVCDCKPNYAGTHCEKQHEHCETVTCLPHGECFNLTDLGTFKCYCQSDYTGRLCNSRIAKTTATPGETAPQEVDQNFLIIMAVCAGLICLTVAAFVYMRMKQKRIGIESQYCSSRAEVSTRSTKRTNSATGYSKATSAWAYIKSRAGKKRSASQQSSRTYEYSNVTRR